ncbi:MAG: DNA replication/repair protein RecF [Blautia sp.]|nr:DNA replication/repair protein RecF [Blautia sp.]
MHVSSLALWDYRNYERLDLTLDEGTNIFYGNNAQGKTNILEAIYLCGTTRSYRGGKDRDLIRFGQKEAHIRMQVKREVGVYQLDMHLRRNLSKGIAVNGVPVKKAKEILDVASLVFFSPEDLNIIKNGPSERRSFLDAQLCQLDKVYLSDLTEYTKVVNNRNKVLKDVVTQKSLLPTLEVWDELLCRYGKSLIEKRSSFMEEVLPIAREIHRDITGGKEELLLVYDPNVSAKDFPLQVALNRERDLSLKMTTVGPHRDDMIVKAGGIDLRRFGSQGQQRTAALSLKLAELAMAKKKQRENPVLLLDDVLSELDTIRQESLLERIHDIQTLMTCTGLEDFVSHRFSLNRVFEVVEGKVFVKESR